MMQNNIYNTKSCQSILSGFVCILSIMMAPGLSAQTHSKTEVTPNDKLFSEELGIITDRDLYLAGERVWVKITELNSLTLSPSGISKVIYADILDLENNPVNQLKISADGFSGSASFLLPDTLRSGNYILRAYTNWMQNFSKDLFASKTLSVINPFDKISNLKIPLTHQNPDSLIFYPEGGLMLSGTESRLGFRTLGKNSSPVSVNGYIVTDSNDTVCVVKSGNNGYGMVRFKPTWPARYYVVFSERNQLKKFLLPEVHKEGILLRTPAKNADSGAIAILNISPGYLEEDKQLYLVINSSGVAGYRKEIKSGMKSGTGIAAIDLPYGISNISVVDGKENTLSSLWVSKDQSDGLNYKINIPGNDHHPRQKIKIEISALDSQENRHAADLSVSVAKAVSVNRISPHKRLRQMPGMFPACEDCNISDINDYLVFYKPHVSQSDRHGTNGNHTAVYLPELEGHLISGTIKERISGEPLRKEKITLSFVGKSAMCLFAITDDNGNFKFVTTENGLKEIVIQPLTPDKECYVDLNSPFAAGYADYDHGSLYLDTSKLGEINNLIISMQINNIYEPFYKNISSPPEEVRYNFYGQPDNTIMMSRYIELISVKEIISELINGVSTTMKDGKVNFRLTKRDQELPYKNGPLVLVDGIPVYDLEKVIAISSKDIEKVDVLMDRYYISGNILDGLLHFITKKGDLSAMELDKSVFRLEYDLLQREEAFYSPDYSVDSVRNNHLPDFRNTLYWNPDLHTDKNGKASVEFYSSDESGEYLITIDGIAPDGRRGSVQLPLDINTNNYNIHQK